MTIKTKFKIGDSVFFMHSNKVREGTIKKISINIESHTEIRYKLRVKETFTDKSLLENNIFLTKEELLKTL